MKAVASSARTFIQGSRGQNSAVGLANDLRDDEETTAIGLDGDDGTEPIWGTGLDASELDARVSGART